MKKYAIFTAIVGNYDKILQPKVVDPDFDYILFSNDINGKKIGIWQVHKIDYINKDQIKIARWVKAHPEDLLHGYDFSIWMDANIQVETDFIYRRSKELFNTKKTISSMVHPYRNCIYQEMLAVFALRCESAKTIIKWSKFLKKENYPKNIGLHETNVVFRNHTTDDIKKIDNMWWNYIKEYSRRDQLSFNFILWKCGVSCEPFLPSHQSTRNSEHFKLIPHANSQIKMCTNKEDFSWMQYYCTLFPEERDAIESIFSKILDMRHPIFWLCLYGIKYKIIFYWKTLQKTIKKMFIQGHFK